MASWLCRCLQVFLYLGNRLKFSTAALNPEAGCLARVCNNYQLAHASAAPGPMPPAVSPDYRPLLISELVGQGEDIKGAHLSLKDVGFDGWIVGYDFFGLFL